jgi:hypothetical protein
LVDATNLADFSKLPRDGGHAREIVGGLPLAATQPASGSKEKQRNAIDEIVESSQV